MFAGATAADAPPTSEKVKPAAPSAGTAFVILFCFEACFTRGIFESSSSSQLFFHGLMSMF
jgi:hypothetical protein